MCPTQCRSLRILHSRPRASQHVQSIVVCVCGQTNCISGVWRPRLPRILDSLAESAFESVSEPASVPSLLVKEQWEADFYGTPSKQRTARLHECIKHQMPKELSRIMKPGEKAWPALTEERTNRCAAAWSWLHTYMDLRRQGLPIRIGDARLSKLLLPWTVVRHKPEQAVFASMGNALWGGIGIPLTSVVLAGDKFWKFVRAPVRFLHVHKASDWEVLPYQEQRVRSHGLVLQECGTPVPLMLNALRTPGNMLLGLLRIGCGTCLPIYSATSRVGASHKR